MIISSKGQNKVTKLKITSHYSQFPGLGSKNRLEQHDNDNNNDGKVNDNVKMMWKFKSYFNLDYV